MIEIIQQRLARYQAANLAEETQALKEILQELALYALWRGGFFEVAAFQGGASLRILHRLPRFSEDLDFILPSRRRISFGSHTCNNCSPRWNCSGYSLKRWTKATWNNRSGRRS